jgi:hypothetical protein
MKPNLVKMRGRIGLFALLLAALLVSPEAHAMKSPVRCSVVGGEKLPSSTGGAHVICSEFEKAMAAAAPKLSYTARIEVLSSSRLAATLVVNGRELPKQNFAVMDRQLDRASIARFAAAVAAEAAKASTR